MRRFNFKLWFIRKVAGTTYAPKRLKVFCLGLCMVEIRKGFESAFKDADFSKLTATQRAEIQAELDRMSGLMKMREPQ